MRERASFQSLCASCVMPCLILAACATGVEPQRGGDDDGGTAATGGSIGGASGSTGSGGSLGGSSGSSGSGGNAAFGATGGSSGAAGSGGTGGGTSGSGGTGGAAGTGGSTGGSGGAGGTGGSGATGGSGGACTPASPDAGTGVVVLQYRNNEDQSPTDVDIKPIFNLKNTSGAALDLTEITIRYFYTKEPASTDQSFACYYVQLGCANVTAAFMPVTPARPGADYYFEVGFTTGSLGAGAETGDLKLHFHTNPYASFNEADDYSHCRAASNVDWDKVTVYRNGTLVWGSEP